MNRKAVAGRLTSGAYGAGWKAIRVAPGPLAEAAFRSGADLAVRRDGPRVRQLRRNLARVVAPQILEATVSAGMRSYARYWCETFRLPALDHERVLARTQTENTGALDDALAAGRGVVLALPHSGNWEVAGLWLVQRGHPFATVAERLRPESLYDRFVDYRENLGMTVLPLTRAAPSPTPAPGDAAGASTTRQLLARLRAGGVVCLVADRDLSQRGVEVTFFDERTRMPAGPAQLALSTGAALLPAHTFYDGRGWGQWIGAPIEFGPGNQRQQISAATQALADCFTGRIAAHPADWHMLQPLWPGDVDEPGERSG